MTDSHAEARQYALKLLSYRSRSEKELRDRLKKKGIQEAVISSTIEHLRNLGLVNDVLLAEILMNDAINIKLLSQNGARQYVLSRGVPREITDAAFEKLDNMDIENARKIVARKLEALKDYPGKTVKRRLCNFLLRRGYSYETIAEVLKDKNFKEEER
ncbi:MAG: regulatory protein RecX [Nitrospirota bacterium]